VHHLSDVHLLAALVIATKPSSSGQKGPPGRIIDRASAPSRLAAIPESTNAIFDARPILLLMLLD